jgi:hypothetical protein
MNGQFAFTFWNKSSTDTRADRAATRLTFSEEVLSDREDRKLVVAVDR